MLEILLLWADHFDYVLLFFIRVSGLMISSPIFGRKNLPNTFKISMCVVFTYIMLLAVPVPETFPEYNMFLEYIILCVLELLFGVALGYVTTTFFNLAFTAGHMIDNQLGFSMVNVYDIQNNMQVPIFGNLLNIAMLISFIAVDGHLKLIDILYGTILRVPIGNVALGMDIVSVAAEVFCLTFVLGMMVAMPIVAAGLLLEVALGVLIRTVPQMNMFVIGIPLKLLIGMMVLTATISMFIYFNEYIFSQMFEEIMKIFGTFGVVR